MAKATFRTGAALALVEMLSSQNEQIESGIRTGSCCVFLNHLWQ